MIKIANAQLWVHDQDEALAFYTKKLGMEVRADVTLAEMGDFRWLTVGPAGQPDVSIVLMAIPGPPVMDSETAEQVRTLMAKGFAGTSSSRPTTARPPTRSSRAAASSSPSSPRSAPTGSTRRSATRRATASGSPRSGRWRRPPEPPRARSDGPRVVRAPAGLRARRSGPAPRLARDVRKSPRWTSTKR